MEFFGRQPAAPTRLGILPGTFNPVTVAHLELARAALVHVDEVVFVLPRVLPHKDYSGAGFEQRLELLRTATADESRWSVAVSERGLFAEIAAEFQVHYPGTVRLAFLCGRDAAERIVDWDYGRPGAILEMLRDFDLLVAPRNGPYDPPPECRHAVRKLDVGAGFEPVSATEVRERMASGLPWEHLVPPVIRDRVRRIYSA